MKLPAFILLFSLVLLPISMRAGGMMKLVETEVEATGMAPGDSAHARELALADALRNAVRIGAGVDIASLSESRNFQLEYDRIFSASFGYVRAYEVLDAGLGSDGIYRLTISARVGEGEPGRRDIVALQQMVRLRGSPRIVIEVDELVEDVPLSDSLAEPWFEESARELQLQVVDMAQVNRNDDALAERDAVLGDAVQAALRRADYTQEADFILQVTVRGRYLGERSLMGLKPRHGFSFAVDLRLLRPNGQVIATVSLPAEDSYDSALDAPVHAAREILREQLSGDGTVRYPGGWAIYRQLLAQWMTEADLGSLKRLEFIEMPDADFERVQAALLADPRVTGVWPREYDRRGRSLIEVETRLGTAQLKDVILSGLGSAWAYDRGTDNTLQFTLSGENHLTRPSTEQAEVIGSEVSTVSEQVAVLETEPPAPQNPVPGEGVAESSEGPTDTQPTKVSLTSLAESEFPRVDAPPEPLAEADSPELPNWAWSALGAGSVLALVGVYFLGRRS